MSVREISGYRIIEHVVIGETEIVTAENENSAPGYRYMCGELVRDGCIMTIKDCKASGEYSDVLVLFGEKIKDRAEKIRDRQAAERSAAGTSGTMDQKSVHMITDADSLEGRIIVIKPENLRPEYRRITHQLKLCTGGFGSRPYSVGRSCFCVNLFSGETEKFFRSDVMGTIDRKDLPEWAERTLSNHYRRTGRENRTKEGIER